MRVPFTLGTVGHFGLAVRDPKKSAQWFERAFGLKKQFDFEDGIAVGNDYVTIAVFKGRPSPETIGHMSFHLPDMATLRKALNHLKKHRSRIWKIQVTRSARRPRARRTSACGFTTRTVIAGSFPFKVRTCSWRFLRLTPAAASPPARAIAELVQHISEV